MAEWFVQQKLGFQLNRRNCSITSVAGLTAAACDGFAIGNIPA